MPFRLYNTLTRKVEPFVPRDASRVTFYSCGPTVYDDAHIGNFRSFLAADLLRRWVESPLCDVEADGGGVHTGPRRVVHVMNITDVGHMTDDAEGGEGGEDRMAVAGRRIAEAKKAGKLPPNVEIDPRDPYAIAAFYAERFERDARRLGLKVALEAVKDASLLPRATANIDAMKRVIERLLERGFAYVAGEAGRRAVYFDVRRYPAYGALSGNTLERLREGAGERVNAGNQSQKRTPADFLLWKEDSSHIMKWPSPSLPDGEAQQLGAGYPGWHIECTAMAGRRLLGEGAFEGLLLKPGSELAVIDLHSGGEDNIFPHHECEVAQSVCAFCVADEGTAAGEAGGGRGAFARHWFHARHLFVEGEKMSKSKGNFYTAQQLIDAPAPDNVEPAALRLELIKTHYRSNANFTMQGLKDSARTVERWRRFMDATPTGADERAGEGVREDARQGFIEAMNADLNIAGALGVVHTFISAAGGGGGSGVGESSAADVALMKQFDAVLGVLELEKPRSMETEIGVFVGCEPDGAVVMQLHDRAAAKRAKEFVRSDAIRDELAAKGYAIKDVAGGRVEVRRV